MNVRTWDKVTLRWNCGFGLAGSVRVDTGEFDPEAYSQFRGKSSEAVHGLFGMEVFSLPRQQGSNMRQGEMTIDIHQNQGPNVTTQVDAIVAFLEVELSKLKDKTPGCTCYCELKPIIIPPKSLSWNDTKFTISFIQAQGVHFCDAAIEVARAVFTALGIHDQGGHYLAGFSVKRETFVMIDDVWITFARWLRMNHCLPITGPEDL